MTDFFQFLLSVLFSVSNIAQNETENRKRLLYTFKIILLSAQESPNMSHEKTFIFKKVKWDGAEKYSRVCDKPMFWCRP